MRVYEQPIPQVIVPVTLFDDEHEQNGEISAIDTGDTDHIEPIPANTFEEEEEVCVDVKPPLFDEITVATDDANALDSMFDDATKTSDDEFVFESPDERDSNMQRFVYSDDVVCFFTLQEDFRPILEYEYQIKAHDLLCNNRPFKQNVRHLFLFVTAF